MTQGRWPLHPKPRDWEDLETRAHRIAAAWRRLRYVPAACAGVPLERLRGMRSGAVVAHMVEGVAAWMETEAGQTVRERLREVARRMCHRPMDIPDRRRSHITSDQYDLQSID